jgi:hypothetical protein
MHPNRLLAVLTILAIAGTLMSCGRYGSPVRPLPAAATDTEAAADTEAAGATATADEEADSGPSKD